VPDLPRRWPLEGALAPGLHGAPGADGPGVVITDRRGLAMVQLMARAGEAQALAAALGIAKEPGRASVTAAFTALPLAPGQWLLVAAGGSEDDLEEEVAARAGNLGGVIGQSHGRTALRLSGPRARDVLAKGCRLDLHPRAFPPASCAQTPIARLAVLIHQADAAPTFDLYPASSYAIAFLEWLTASAGEFGYELRIEDVART
jgi:heterotetrameric sarcosine oxidase gamma subunit